MDNSLATAEPVGHEGTRVEIGETARPRRHRLARCPRRGLCAGRRTCARIERDRMDLAAHPARRDRADLARHRPSGTDQRRAVLRQLRRDRAPARASGGCSPLTVRRRVSLRVRNFETGRLKVNDLDGNPLEIAAIVVWQVADTAKSVYAVDDYAAFVSTQAESALRHVATSHPYDDATDAGTVAARVDRRGLRRAGARGRRADRRGRRGDRRGADLAPGLRPGDRPGRCCGASRPTPWSRRGAGSSRVPSAWSRWR